MILCFFLYKRLFLCTSGTLLCDTLVLWQFFEISSLFNQLVSMVLCVHREPDSTYFELPPGSQSGERPLPSTSTPGSHRSAAEGSMDVYHMRDMNDNVMVGTLQFSLYLCGQSLLLLFFLISVT